MKPLRGEVKNGELVIYAKSAFRSFKEKLEGKQIVLKLTQFREKRTLPQNKYYWWILEYIEEETGNNRNDLHQLFKDKFLSKEVMVLDETSKSYVSTTKLNTKEMTDYIEQIRQFMNEWGLYIPEANEMQYIG